MEPLPITTTSLNPVSRLRSRSVTLCARNSLASLWADVRNGSTAIVGRSSGRRAVSAAGGGTDSRRSPTMLRPATKSAASPAATYIYGRLYQTVGELDPAGSARGAGGGAS